MKQPTGLDETTDGAGPSVTVGGADGRPITRSLILQTALEIVDRDGVDGLSMRRLSDAVNRDTTVLYRHLPNKAAVLDGVAELVLTELSVDTTDPDWSAQLRTVAHDFRRLALAHPNVVPLLVTRPLATPLDDCCPTALQPKKRLTRCRMTSDACWISSAIGPSTRNTSVAGSCGWPSTGRGHWIFSGSEWAAISGPAISAQRVTSSRAAKPCLA